ncbi:MAG: hypothetical protein KAS66_02065 [Candidatus Omnitrophica bacterium]|nr:hypothetical protein [Candidatus Omnitrophota bacterium]
MKKCHGCHQEIDRYAIACQYCGKLAEEREKSEEKNDPKDQKDNKRSDEPS